VGILNEVGIWRKAAVNCLFITRGWKTIIYIPELPDCLVKTKILTMKKQKFYPDNIFFCLTLKRRSAAGKIDPEIVIK
jgi:hypothetical protein